MRGNDKTQFGSGEIRGSQLYVYWRFVWRNMFCLMAKLRSCVKFDRSAQAEIVCRFRRYRVSISSGVRWSSAKIWKIFTEVENCRERGAKVDRGRQYRHQKSKGAKTALKQAWTETGRPVDKAGWPPSQPVFMTCTGVARSTARSTVARRTQHSLDHLSLPLSIMSLIAASSRLQFHCSTMSRRCPLWGTTPAPPPSQSIEVKLLFCLRCLYLFLF